MSTDRPEITAAAQRAIDSARSIREADTEDEVARLSTQARNEVAAMVERARDTPLRLVGLDS
jgi:hypothetical protein